MKDKYKHALMDMAVRFGQTSEATRLKVGSLLVKNDSIIAMGVNGTRRGWHTNACEDENGKTSSAVRHSEIAALDKLRRTHETSVDAELFVSHSPCLNCCIELVDAGIKKVYYKHTYRCNLGLQYLQDNNVLVEQLT